MMKGRTWIKASLWRRKSTGLLTVGLVLAIVWKSMSSSTIESKATRNTRPIIEKDLSKIKDTRLLAPTADYENPDLPNRVGPDKQYHVIVTADGSVYNEWQVRVGYFWYLRIKSKRPRNMGGFTRILHSGKPDDWMHEIPTVIVDPLPRDLEKIANGYVVLNRPYAIKQWVQRHMPKIKERYVLMAEPDHIFIRAPPLWASRTRAAAYPFFYIKPNEEPNDKIVKKFNKNHVPMRHFRPIGNSPVMISKEKLGPIVEVWSNISIEIKKDPEADKEWGWIQEMYAWSIASAIAPGGPLKYFLRPEFMLQPPWDTELVASNGKKAAIIHYTYANDFDADGNFTPAQIGVWHFDKRDYMEKYPLKRTRKPPIGCTNAATKLFIRCINIAAKTLDGWVDRAYNDSSEIKHYFGSEGDILDPSDPEDLDLEEEEDYMDYVDELEDMDDD